VTDKSATLPSLVHGMIHARSHNPAIRAPVHAEEFSERFACERKVFEYECISILNVCALKQGKCEQSVWDIYVFQLKFEYGRFEYYKRFEHKISKGKYMHFFLRLAGIAVGYFKRKVYLFSMRNLLLKNKYFLHFRQGRAHCWIY